MRHLRVGVLLLAAALANLAACDVPVNEKPRVPLQRTTGTLPDRVAGEYIVTVQAGGDEVLLRRLYATYGVRDIAELGPHRFLVKLERDPGLDEIRRAGLASGQVSAVQPNFVYRGFGQ